MRKFRLIDNEPIKTSAELGELGIEVKDFPLIKVWNRKEDLREMHFVAVLFERSGMQVLSEIQLEELDPSTEINLSAYDNEDEDFETPQYVN